jgi:hypothetical protein
LPVGSRWLLGISRQIGLQSESVFISPCVW